jgi:choline dehydrogenase
MKLLCACTILLFCLLSVEAIKEKVRITTHNDPCHVLGLASSYGAIVVGSGPGGSVSARRLAEANGGSLSVLQVERGGYYTECPGCEIPNNFFVELDNPITGLNVNFQPQAYMTGNPVISTRDAAIQGGASTHNGMVWIHSDNPYYFDTYWPENWNWENMIQYFMKVENYTFPAGFYGPGGFNYAANNRGNEGLVEVTQRTPTNGGGFTNAFINAAVAVWPNIPVFRNGSLNNGNVTAHGVGPAEMSNSGVTGTRHSAFSSYIQTYTGSNLRAIAHVRADRIIFEGTTVTGVELVFVNVSTQETLSSSCIVNSPVVVVSAGALGTPKLLQLSGIGAAAELESFRIPVVVNNPEVGQNFDDQFGFTILAESGTTTIPTPNYDAYGLVFYNVEDNPLLPDNMGINFLTTPVTPTFSLAYVGPTIAYSQSRGSILLASANPDVQAKITLNFLSTESDRITMALMLNQTLQLIQEMGLVLLSNPCLTAPCNTLNEQLNAYSTVAFLGPPAHFAGTASIGKVLNPLTMGVIGTQGLYVLDASAFPLSPDTNTQNTVYAVAEYGITLVLADIEERCGGWK